MRKKVSDYVADFFSECGIHTVFTVVGGGAMHLNDSFGHHERIRCIYNHHEQASAMAAEAYYRVNNELAGVCVTSGPGAINALNGVAGAYQDSIPVIIVSGQTKTGLMTKNSGLNLRTLGNQEFDIISALGKMTKYAVTVMKPEEIRFCLEKAFFLALDGRPGPCWLEIPIDVQGTYIETDTLMGYGKEEKTECLERDNELVLDQKVQQVLEKLIACERPVIYAGNGIRISGAVKKFQKLTELAHVPVATCWDSIDLIETDSPYYVGRAGIMGNRAGNFAVQNSDFLLAIGNRLNIYQVGYQVESWAREAFVTDVDIDRLELKKKTIRVDLPICSDAGVFMSRLIEKIEKSDQYNKQHFEKWVNQCNIWKAKYPVVQKKHYEQRRLLNVYALIDKLSRELPKGMITVVANGSASVVGSASYYIKERQRFIMNCGISSMGYDLPAAIGACLANERNPIVCIAGDGSIMMNLQELQTIVTNKLPIKIIIINNSGYQQIRITQTNLFHENFVGIGPDSHDLSFPKFEKIAIAFEIPYKRCDSMDILEESIQWLLGESGYAILEAVCSTEQTFEPKSATKKLEDGTLYSPPLEDMAPFLPREELQENMYIKLLDEL